ncbi:MAG: (Fe-S)-binding protein, partial [Acidimicrobiia bacterium]
ADSDQTCCGALAAHGGYADEARRLGERNIKALGSADLIIADVAGCGAHLKAYGTHGPGGAALSERVADITEVVWAAIEDGRLPTLPPNGEVVAVQDPCHLEHGQGITEQPRAILRAAGYQVVDADPGGLCCGAAGVYQLEYPETSHELGAAKAAKVQATGTRLVASANAGCEMQLRNALGRGFVVAHPVEFYWEAWSATR